MGHLSPPVRKKIKETTVFESFYPDDSNTITNSNDDYLIKIETWKREQKFYDYRLTKVLNEIETVVYEQAQSFLSANDFYINDADENASKQEDGNFDTLLLAPVCESIPEPAASAHIREITTHFREIADPNQHIDYIDTHNEYAKHVGVSVAGFVFKYSDGIEKEFGNLRGSTSSATVTMFEDEHITYVAQTLWKDTSLAFRPSSSIGIRKVFFQITNYEDAERVVYFEDGQVVETRWSSGSDSLRIEGGDILRSFEWSIEELKISGVKTQRKPDRASQTNSMDNTMNCAVPSLQELAKSALPKPSQYVQELKDQQFDMVRKSVNQIIVSAQGKLLKKFLERESRINSLDKVNCSLEMVVDQQIHRDAVREKTRILTMCDDEYIKLSCIKSDITSWAREEVNLLWAGGNLLRVEEVEDDGVYERYNDQLELLQALSNADGRMVLCKNVYCLRTFIPSYVRSRKRCSVKGCFEVVPNCGCIVNSCERCHTSFCRRHMMSHEKVCLETFDSKCGWRENGITLKPEMCGCVFDGILRRCNLCSTHCCYTCSVPCKGSESDTHYKLSEGYTLKSNRDQVVSACNNVWCIACKSHSESNYSRCDECTNMSAFSPTLTLPLKSNQMPPHNRTA